MAEEGFGQYLRSQRELRQISLEEVAAGTKIGIHLLKALEEDRWDALPAEVFVKGFIKSYAEYIGLDPEDTLLRYEATKQKDVSYEPEPEFNIPKGYSGPLGLKSSIFLKTLIIVVLIILVAFIIYFFSPSSIKLKFNIWNHKQESKTKMYIPSSKIAPINKNSEYFLNNATTNSSLLNIKFKNTTNNP